MSEGLKAPPDLGHSDARRRGRMSLMDDLVLLAITIAIVSVVMVVLLVAIYLWFVKGRRDEVLPEDEEPFDGGPYDIP